MNYIIIIIIIIIINTVPHKARITQTYLDDNGIHLMEHRPYSPDLASCDFWPFPKVKSALAGKHFQRSKTLLKLCMQRWGPYLLQSTKNAFRSGGWGCNDL